jgi:hypothetical protein
VLAKARALKKEYEEYKEVEGFRRYGAFGGETP